MNSENIFHIKNNLRNSIKQSILSLENKESKDIQIQQDLLKYFQPNQKIILYRADRYEVNLDKLIDENNSNSSYNFYFPKVVSKIDKTLEFIKPISWKVGNFSLLEPLGVEKINPFNVDWIIIPALGFNSANYRLGRGGGFYDRALQGIDSKKIIGLTYLEIYPVDFIESRYDIKAGMIIKY